MRAGLAVGTRQTCPRCRRAVLVYAPLVRDGEQRVARVGPPMLRKHRVRPRYGPLCPGSYTFVGERALTGAPREPHA